MALADAQVPEAKVPADFGTRKHPGCADRTLCCALFVVLATVLLFSLAIGLRDLTAIARS